MEQQRGPAAWLLAFALAACGGKSERGADRGDAGSEEGTNGGSPGASTATGERTNGGSPGTAAATGGSGGLTFPAAGSGSSGSPGLLGSAGDLANAAAAGGGAGAAAEGVGGSAGVAGSLAETEIIITGPAVLTSVTIERFGAMGFCIDDGQFVAAQIQPDQDATVGQMLLSGSVHRGWDDTSPECELARCAVTQPVEEMVLTREELSELVLRWFALPTGDCDPEPNYACDPCLITEIFVNDQRYVDDPCAAETCPGYFESIRALQAFIDGLAPAEE